MRIATWNVERLKHIADLDKILSACQSIAADILVLTETDQRLHPDYRFCYATPTLTQQPINYAPTENRVSIYTNYPCVRQHPTYDAKTSICVELETECGNILVYGTIIGIYGNRHPSFMEDLKHQADDFLRLSKIADGLCVCGDFNCSFADNYYFTKAGRSSLLEVFEKAGLRLLTEKQPECIDHIAVSERLVSDKVILVEEWNIDKKLSDHKGIAVEIFSDGRNAHEE